MPITIVVVVAAIVLLAVIVVITGHDDPLWHCHTAPDEPYNLHDAHHAFQAFIDCDASYCDAKAAAKQVLIEAGHLHPATYTR